MVILERLQAGCPCLESTERALEVSRRARRETASHGMSQTLTGPNGAFIHSNREII
jgi:hypothetical protein